MNNIPLTSQQELFRQSQVFIAGVLENSDSDESFIIKSGYGFEDFLNEKPVNMTDVMLSNAFESIMHIMDYLDETSCQDEDFFSLKDAVEDIFYVPEAQASVA